MVTSFKHYNDVMDRRAACVRMTCGYSFFFLFFFFYLFLWLVRVCEIEFSHMGKNSGNSDLVCEKNTSITMPLMSCRYLLQMLHFRRTDNDN